MSDALGLSIGAANLVAAQVGSIPVTRRCVVSLFAQRPPEVGVAEENPNVTADGLVVEGFVERVGDPAAFVAADGSTHRSDVLMVTALDAIARTVGYAASMTIAVPAHWPPDAVVALREALRRTPALAPGGVSPALISDATAALTALYAKPGFPTDGVVALCDFGASGTSITLADAAKNFQHIGETVRTPAFSGDQIDQAILGRLQAACAGPGNSEAAHTAPVGSLPRRLAECRRAKEQLSAATVAVVPAEMPGVGDNVRLSRTELEELISEPLNQFIGTLDAVLRHRDIAATRLAAVATVGGGACIPLVTERLGLTLQAPVVTTPQPALSAAVGAAVLAEHRYPAGPPSAAGTPNEAPTALGSAPRVPTDVQPAAPPDLEAPAAGGSGTACPTDAASAGWAAAAAAAGAAESVEDGAHSATYRALAWSQEASAGDQSLPPSVEDPRSDDDAPEVAAGAAGRGDIVAPGSRRPRPRRPSVIFGMVAMAALVALLGAGVVVVKLSTTHSHTAPSRVPTPSPLPSVGPLPPPPPPAPKTVTVTTRVPVPPKRTAPRSTIKPTPTATARTTATTAPTTTWRPTIQPTTTPGYPDYSSTSPQYPVATTPSTTVPTPPQPAPDTVTYGPGPYPVAPTGPYPVQPH